MYLNDNNLKGAAEFVNGALWADIKRCLMERRPPAATAEESPSTAAHRGFQREAFEACIREIEKLPRDLAPKTVGDIPESLLDERD